MTKWYDIRSILKYDFQYAMILGGRSIGKSFSTMRFCIDEFFKTGVEWVIIKRYREDLTPKIASSMLNNQIDYMRETYNKDIRYYQGKFYVYDVGTSNSISNCKVMGHVMSLNEADRYKGMQLPNVKYIVFEELMSMDNRYLKGEVNMLIQIVSTIARSRTDVKVFMLCNAISKHNPYSEALGVALHKMDKGEIITKVFHEGKFKTKFLIQRCEGVNVFDTKTNTEKVVYTAFGEAQNNMVNTGDFEIRRYPKFTNGVCFEENMKIKPKGHYVAFGVSSRTDIYIQYLDMFYEVYKKFYNGLWIYGFKRIKYRPNPRVVREGEFKKRINRKRLFYLINGSVRTDQVVNVNSLLYFKCPSEIVNQEMMDLISAIMQKNYVVDTDETGEDVNTAFKMAGLTDIN